MGQNLKSLMRYSPKNSVFSADYPDFSPLQLPSASLGFRGQCGIISANTVGAQATKYAGGGPEA